MESLQSNPNRLKLSPTQYWFRTFCRCCNKLNDKRKRSFPPHFHQKRPSKTKTLRDHRNNQDVL